MRSVLFCSFLAFLLSGACGRLSGSDPFPNNDGEIPSDFAATLERMACYGKCPVYKLSVAADGTVVFDGQEFTATTGRAGGKLSSAKMRELIEAFRAADYFGFEDIYSEGRNCPVTATDSPTAITSLRINGRQKKIHHYLGCSEGSERLSIYPPELYELENRIDEIVGTKQWIGGGK